MNTSKLIYEKLNHNQFSYGEAISLILEHKGKAISTLPNEDFVFPDNSTIRLTNNGITLMEFLQE
jgi:hypothetical protein